MSFHDIENPTGGMPMERVIDQPTPEQHLLERILSSTNMEQAWKRVKANKGAPGVDGITIEQFPDHTRSNWKTIRESLMTGSYKPLPVKRVEIPKATGGTRPLGIPAVLDRLIQQSIAQVLTPIFDPEFSESSFGFRPRRSAKDAVRQVREYIRQGYRIAVDIDLAKFFDTVNHGLLMYLVSRKVHDMPGGVGAGGEKPPATRLETSWVRFTVLFVSHLQEDSFLDRECCLHPDQYPAQASKGGFLKAFRHAGFSLLMLPETMGNAQMPETFLDRQSASRFHCKKC